MPRRKSKSQLPAILKFAAISAAIAIPLAAAAYFFVLYEPSLSDQEYFDNAQQLYQKGESRGAVIELKNALKTNPNNKQARFLLGKIYLGLEQGAAAEKELERSSGLKTDPGELKLLLARAKLLQGKPKEALNTLTDGVGGTGKLSYPENLLVAQAHFDMREWSNSADFYNLALTQRPASVEAVVGLARISYTKGDIAIAKTYLGKLKARADNNWQAWLLRGDIARGEKSLSEAKLAYQKAFELKANAIEPRLYHALIALSEENLDEAAQDAQILVRINSKHPAGHYIQGQIYFAQKELKKAQSSFEEAIRYIDYPLAFRQLGIVHYQLDSLVQAEEYLKKYIAIQPNDAEAEKVLSALYIKQNKLEEAKTTLKSVASKATLNEPLQRMMAGLEQATGKPENAARILNNLLGDNPESVETSLQLGQTLLRQGKPRRALDVLNKAAEKNPKSTQAKLHIVTAHIALKNYQAALEIANQIKQLEPDNPRFSSIDGIIYLASGDTKKAVEVFEQSQVKYPGNIVSAHQLALIAIRGRQYDEAKTHYNNILAKHQDHLLSLIQLGLIEYEQGQLQQGQKTLERAIKAHPDQPRPKLALAQAHMANNNPEKALNWLRQIADHARQSPQYLFALGHAYILNQKPAQATEALVKLNTIRPTGTSYWLEAKARFMQQDLAGSQKALLNAKKFAPDNTKLDDALFEVLVTKTELAIRQKHSVDAQQGLDEIKNHEDPLPYLVLRARFEDSKENFDTAANYYQQAIELKPTEKLMASLLRALQLSGRVDEGSERAKTWLQSHPDDKRVALILAGFQIATNQTDAAIQNYESQLSDQPGNPIILNNLAYLYIERDIEKAEGFAKRAYRIAPNIAAVVDTFGWITLIQGDHQKALNALSKAHSLDPNEPSIQYHLASAQAKNDNKIEAIELLRKLSDTDFDEKSDAEALLATLEWKPE